MEPVDNNLYNKTKKYIYKKYPKHSAYRSGLLVKKYKKYFIWSWITDVNKQTFILRLNN